METQFLMVALVTSRLLKMSWASEVDFSRYSICSPSSLVMRNEIELAPMWMAAFNFNGVIRGSMSLYQYCCLGEMTTKEMLQFEVLDGCKMPCKICGVATHSAS